VDHTTNQVTPIFKLAIGDARGYSETPLLRVKTYPWENEPPFAYRAPFQLFSQLDFKFLGIKPPLLLGLRLRCVFPDAA
jgi:hypothetical protein